MSLPDMRKYFDPLTLARLKGLRLRAQRIVEGFWAGLHRSPRRGFSIEFAEHRQYTPGDDLRYVDWKVFGRSDKLYLKQFEDETNLIVYLLVDCSGGMAYRGPTSVWSKWEYAQCLAASLAWLVLHQHDAVGMATFDTRLGHLQGETSVRASLWEFVERCRRRGVVVVMSDLLDEADAVLQAVRLLRAHRHDVVVFHVLDPAEVAFSFDEPIRFCGLEIPRRLAVDARALRSAYLQEFRTYQERLESGLRQAGVDYWMAESSRPLHEVLVPFLNRRLHRVY
jgi:uncharacterized protein (DUF58 family)